MCGFRSLLNVKREFQPECHPLLMAHPDQAGLAAIGIVLTRARLPNLIVAQAAKVLRGKTDSTTAHPRAAGEQ